MGLDQPGRRGRDQALRAATLTYPSASRVKTKQPTTCFKILAQFAKQDRNRKVCFLLLSFSCIPCENNLEKELFTCDKVFLANIDIINFKCSGFQAHKLT